MLIVWTLAVLLGLPLLASCTGPMSSPPVDRPTPTVSSKSQGNGLIGWPFATSATSATNSGSWLIENGYNWNTGTHPPGLDHGCSTLYESCYELYSFDFQRRDGATAGQHVLSPVTGTALDIGAALGNAGHCVRISIDGASDYFIMICHVDNPVQGGVHKGDFLGTIDTNSTYGDHIHMTLYYFDHNNPGGDTKANVRLRKAISFSSPWTIGRCSYPADGSADQWASTPVPCSSQASATSTPQSSPTTAMYVTSDDGTLYALDPATGRQLWSVATAAPDPNSSGADVVGITPENIYVESGAPGPAYPSGEHLYAIDRQLHHLLWVTHLAVGYVGERDSVVYVTDATGIAALNASNDQRYWHYDAPNADSDAVAIAGNTLYLSAYQDATHSYVDGINARDGSRLWRQPLQGSSLALMSVANGRLYVATRGASEFSLMVETFDASTGTPGWIAQTNGTEMSITTAGSDVYLHTTGSDPSGAVLALDANTGHTVFDLGAQDACFDEPYLSGGVLYDACNHPGSSANLVSAYNAQAGKAIWQRTLPGSYASVDTLGSSVLFVHTSSPSGESFTTIALDASTGSVLWSQPGTCLSAIGGIAYLSNQGTLIARNATTGTEIWQRAGVNRSSPVVVA